MSEFKDPPVLVLDTMEDARKVIETPGWRCGLHPAGYIWSVKCPWLIGLIAEIEAAGKYPYNSTVKRLAEQRLGYPPQTDEYYSKEGDNLSLLIYNAQCYKRSDELRRLGYVPFSWALIEQAGEGGQITIRSGEVLNVRLVGSKLYAMRKYARKSALSPMGQPCRITKTGKKRESTDAT